MRKLTKKLLTGSEMRLKARISSKLQTLYRGDSIRAEGFDAIQSGWNLVWVQLTKSHFAESGRLIMRLLVCRLKQRKRRGDSLVTGRTRQCLQENKPP